MARERDARNSYKKYWWYCTFILQHIYLLTSALSLFCGNTDLPVPICVGWSDCTVYPSPPCVPNCCKNHLRPCARTIGSALISPLGYLNLHVHNQTVGL